MACAASACMKVPHTKVGGCKGRAQVLTALNTLPIDCLSYRPRESGSLTWATAQLTKSTPVGDKRHINASGRSSRRGGENRSAFRTALAPAASASAVHFSST
eukprot:6190523-Pleurochrysis_carterae.AAC.4